MRIPKDGIINASPAPYPGYEALKKMMVAGGIHFGPKTGFTCTVCGEVNDYAAANQPDGTYICSYHGVLGKYFGKAS